MRLCLILSTILLCGIVNIGAQDVDLGSGGSIHSSGGIVLDANQLEIKDRDNTSTSLLVGWTGVGDRLFMAPRKTDGSGWDWAHEFGYDRNEGAWYAEGGLSARGNVILNHNALVSHWHPTDDNNIDHIWHDDSRNIWFVHSDTGLKDTTAGSIGLQLNTMMFCYANETNVDHIWHEESANMWFFNSDSALRTRAGALAGVAQGSFLASYVDESNVDHIWHDETSNTWYFNSDTTVRNAVASSKLRAAEQHLITRELRNPYENDHSALIVQGGYGGGITLRDGNNGSWTNWIQGYGDQYYIGYGDINQPRSRVAYWSAAGLTIGEKGNDKILKVAKGQFGEVEVRTDYWADYVFEDDYDLIPLSEVESYIKKHGHLPNMPSEKEVVKNGMDIGDITKRQQEKIEELTLHLIAAEKQRDDVILMLAEMKKEMALLKKAVAGLKGENNE